MTPLKGEYYRWLLIYVFNNNYVPVIDLNSEDFKQQETPIKFSISKNVVLLCMKNNQVLA